MSTPLGPGSKQKVVRAMAPTLPWPTHYPNLTPASGDRNVSWGAGPNEVCDILRHPASGSRGVVAYLHFGGGTFFDHKQPWLAGSGGGNALAWQLTENVHMQLAPYDFVSVNCEQLRWNSPTPVTHIPAYSATSNPTFDTAVIARLAVFFAWLTANAGANNWDTTKLHLFGSSRGGWLSMLAAYGAGLPVKSLIIESPIGSFEDPRIWWETSECMYGDASAVAWAARSASDKLAVSAIPLITASSTPTFVACANTGTGNTPYGDPLDSGSSIHDVSQCAELTDALALAGVQRDWRIYPRGGWQSPKLGVGLSLTAYDFMRAAE